MNTEIRELNAEEIDAVAGAGLYLNFGVIAFGVDDNGGFGAWIGWGGHEIFVGKGA